MQDTATLWIDYFVAEARRRAVVDRHDSVLREHAELAFFRTDAGFLAPERAAAIYVREIDLVAVSTPWMIDLLALTRRPVPLAA